MGKYDAQARYDAKNTRQVHLKLNVKTDADVLAWLDSRANVQGAIKDLIRADMAKNSATVDKIVEKHAETT